MDSPHSILGVPPSATPEEMLHAYRKLVRRFPPELAPEKFARVHDAYQFLTSPERRMQAARTAPEETLLLLFPAPEIALKPLPHPPPPLDAPALEPLLAPLRRARLAALLNDAFGR